ncbi:Cro/Cl family transcriptional regulator [Ligilactobacillus pabuli]|uniref:Manganese transport regulator n=1 Tax=Ligilactobacillus pabuli TaxID=2886039 RepID=A0ABQ5JKN6_9LACO|nr:metal-dependent transcriptional regulator [Ligilactobacillus pabuli]GKS82438.1 Cro/Cl family transcriptional regulator [Ligilactobacillus pabuli]HIW88421.1 metal-dependent transcriptional regulator [Candidatus Ligilactobacillus excrementipullorum]
MTPKKEDYLKIIFELGGKQRKVSNKQIALSLDVAAGSVTEMVIKLVKEGLVTHVPYAGISLTAAGIELAEKLVRRHRLWETFLVSKLNYKLADVHDDAEVLEHATSDNLVKHLDDFLEHPKECPHGGMIPSIDGEYEEESYDLLIDAETGSTKEVDRFVDNHELLTYLEEINLKIGDKFTVEEHVPFEGPIKVKMLDTGKELSISYNSAHYIFVN